MLIKTDHLVYCVGRASELAQVYEQRYLHGGNPRRSVRLLLELAAGHLNKKIDLVQLDIHKDVSTVWGGCINYPDRCDIVLVQGLNFCWQRFVICKEVFHAVINDEKYWNMDLVGHVQEVTLTFPDEQSKPSPSVVAEVMAEISAMEFLFPYKRRLIALESAIKNDSMAIAELHKVPQKHVERYLSKTYMGILKKYSL